MISLLKKRVFRKLNFLLVSLIFFNGCGFHPNNRIEYFQISNDERIWLEKFFRYFLFYEGAIYTLLGSKPLTEMHIAYDEKNYRELTNKDLEDFIYFELNRNNHEDMLFYKELPYDQKKKAFLIEDKDFIYDIDKLWNKWEKIQKRFPISKKFLLIKRERPIEHLQEYDLKCEKILDVMFVNIFQTALVIQENYDLFKQAVGIDFDPLQVVFELENENSEFWGKIRGSEGRKYCYLWGLLYGYGKENSFGFFWKGRHFINEQAHEKEIDFANTIKRHSSFEIMPSAIESNAFSISKFPIPAFTSFSENDPVVIQYKKERAEIKRLYKNKDFVNFTLELLMGYSCSSKE